MHFGQNIKGVISSVCVEDGQFHNKVKVGQTFCPRLEFLADQVRFLVERKWDIYVGWSLWNWP